MFTHAHLIRQMRVFGDNYDLLAYTLGAKKDDIIKLITSMKKNLYLTPIIKFEGFSLCKGLHNKSKILRISIKGRKALIEENELKIKEIRNYSGKPDEYDLELDTWNPNFNKRADYIRVELTEFDENRGLKEGDNTRVIDVKGYIVDYGKRDFFVDLITPDEEVLNELEYFPFIRVAYELEDLEGLSLHLVELYVPESYLNLVIKSIDYMCRITLCEKVISFSSLKGG